MQILKDYVYWLEIRRQGQFTGKPVEHYAKHTLEEVIDAINSALKELDRLQYETERNKKQ